MAFCTKVIRALDDNVARVTASTCFETTSSGNKAFHTKSNPFSIMKDKNSGLSEFG